MWASPWPGMAGNRVLSLFCWCCDISTDVKIANLTLFTLEAAVQGSLGTAWPCHPWLPKLGISGRSPGSILTSSRPSAHATFSITLYQPLVSHSDSRDSSLTFPSSYKVRNWIARHMIRPVNLRFGSEGKQTVFAASSSSTSAPVIYYSLADHTPPPAIREPVSVSSMKCPHIC